MSEGTSCLGLLASQEESSTLHIEFCAKTQIIKKDTRSCPVKDVALLFCVEDSVFFGNKLLQVVCSVVNGRNYFSASGFVYQFGVGFLQYGENLSVNVI